MQYAARTTAHWLASAARNQNSASRAASGAACAPGARGRGSGAGSQPRSRSAHSAISATHSTMDALPAQNSKLSANAHTPSMYTAPYRLNSTAAPHSPHAAAPGARPRPRGKNQSSG